MYKSAKMHNLYDCPEFKEMSPLKRRQFCYDERICFRCVNSRMHPAIKCTMNLQCHCNSKLHHQLIHLNEEEGKEFASFVQKRKEEKEREKAKEREKEKEANDKETASKKVAAACTEVATASDDGEAPDERRIFNAFVKVGSQIIFRPVVAVNVVNPTNGMSRNAFAVLDNGSDTSCIVSGLAKEMEFQCEPFNIQMSTIVEKDQKVTSEICHFEIESLSDESFSFDSNHAL